jgi:hypothetical protein
MMATICHPSALILHRGHCADVARAPLRERTFG